MAASARLTDVTGMLMLALPLKLVAVPVIAPDSAIVRGVCNVVAVLAFPVSGPTNEELVVVSVKVLAPAID
jgi:hypothetical protein